MSSAQLKNVLFENCQLDGVEFSNCRSQRLEFLDCNLSDIRGITGLRGAQVSQQNLIELAPLMAAEFNFTIAD